MKKPATVAGQGSGLFLEFAAGLGVPPGARRAKGHFDNHRPMMVVCPNRRKTAGVRRPPLSCRHRPPCAGAFLRLVCAKHPPARLHLGKAERRFADKNSEFVTVFMQKYLEGFTRLSY
jgi:hypothetical protein